MKRLMFVTAICIFLISLAGAIDVNVDSASVVQGQQVTVNVNVNSAVEIFGGQFDILYDRNVLNLVSVQQGNYLTQNGGTSVDSNVLGGIDGDLSDGIVNSYFVLRNFSATSGVAGSGVFFSLTFTGRTAGVGYVNVSNIIWSNSSAGRINEPNVVTNGLIIVTSTGGGTTGGDTGGGGGGGSGGDGGSIAPRDDIVDITPSTPERISDVDAPPELRRIALGDGVSYVDIQNSERLILDIPTSDIAYVVSFSIEEGEVKFGVLAQEYPIEEGKLIRVSLDGNSVYLGITEKQDDNFVLALGLNEGAVREEVASEPIVTAGFAAILIISVFVVFVVILVIWYVRQSKKIDVGSMES